MDEMTGICDRCDRHAEGLFPYWNGGGTVYLCEECHMEVLGL